MNQIAILYALAAAALFGLSTPAAKVLVGSVEPMVLAGLLYLGAGLGVALLRRFVSSIRDTRAPEQALVWKDIPWLAGAIAAGGVVGPILLLIGLSSIDAATASLLLTFEGAATALLAWFVFKENFDRRVAAGMGLLAAGAVILSWSGAPTLTNLLGPLAIVGACAAWGLDNNLTRKISLADPLQIVVLKGLIAGPVNLALGLWAGGVLPDMSTLLMSAIVGFLGYGVSLAFFVFALRHLGAARTSAYFSTAPFIGAMAAIVVLGAPLTLQVLAAGALMASGVWLHITERHAHEHVHEPLIHSHPHVHDAHHQHRHNANDPPGEPHTHVHAHDRLRHTHPHTPDMHHTHRHT
jgi:drug/metabolite transporter (DMT)-like permease